MSVTEPDCYITIITNEEVVEPSDLTKEIEIKNEDSELKSLVSVKVAKYPLEKITKGG